MPFLRLVSSVKFMQLTYENFKSLRNISELANMSENKTSAGNKFSLTVTIASL